jgi:trimethyllysine dioxygenase
LSVVSIRDCVLEKTSLLVNWDSGESTKYPWIWLRENAHDADSYHPVTQQRQVFTAGLAADLTAKHAQVNGSDLHVAWTDDSAPAVLPVSFLAKYRRPASARAAVNYEQVLWNGPMINAQTPTIEYDEVMSGEDGVIAWLRKTLAYGFCLAVNTPPTFAATEELLRRVGYVRETIFGAMWEFTPDLSKADTAYTNLELKPHTDGTYSHDAPGAQLLHCLGFGGTGGQSTMVDGFEIARLLKAEHPQHYETLSTVQVPGQYVGDGSHLMAARPVLRHDHTGALVQVSFNNYDRAPFLLPEDEMVAFYDALRAFDLLANSDAMQWQHVLAPGEAMLFDNWRVLHGRFAFTGQRRLCGGYVNREDIESRVRLSGTLV